MNSLLLQSNNPIRFMIQYLPGNRYLILEKRFFSSSVFLVRDISDHSLCFAKQVSVSSQELTAFRFLHHPMLPALHDIIYSSNCSYLILEYLTGPTLEQLFLEHGPLPNEILLNYAASVSSLFQYLHSRNPVCIHGDLKPSNLILHSDHQLYLTDFGSSSLPPFSGFVSGTPYFSSPEQLEGLLSPKCDIYSFGKTFLTLCRTDLPDLLQNLFEDCCRKDPSKRPENFSEIHELLTTFRRAKICSGGICHAK